jgi:hypothetical protein
VLQRVLATFAFYVVLLCHAPARPASRTKKTLLALAVMTFALLIAFNLNRLRDRGQDFSRRLPLHGMELCVLQPSAHHAGSRLR